MIAGNFLFGNVMATDGKQRTGLPEQYSLSGTSVKEVAVSGGAKQVNIRTR